MIKDVFKEDEKYFTQALRFTKSHYENFPVVSFFIKKKLRKHIAVIYQFARQADDIADEGEMPQDDRITKLNKYETKLKNSFSNNFDNGFWRILKLTVDNFNLSENNFYFLIKAFKQDVWKKRYQNFEDLQNYCRLSANPVGRIILELHNIHDEVPKKYSDQICTALQLTNFYQDVSVDIQKGRIYIPEDELMKFNVNETDIQQKNISEKFIKLIIFQTERTKKMFTEGRNLLKFLPFRLKFQILVTIKGGEEILKKIENINYNVLDNRPTLSKIDFLILFLKAIILWR
jgi:squalene synthase HpnC